MRLYTFQSEEALKVLEHGKWYSTQSDRLKWIDEQFIQEDVEFINRKGKTYTDDAYPIYTFANFCLAWNTEFSISQFFSALTTLSGYMCWNLTRMVMFELEVPEDFILNMKSNACWYETECAEEDPDYYYYRKNYKGEKVFKKIDETAGPYFTSDFLKHMRELKTKHEFECLIPYIDKDMIVAYRTFESECGGYSNHDVYTTVVNERLCPLWQHTITLNGDGYPRISKSRDAEAFELLQSLSEENRSFNTIRVIRDCYGAKDVLPYFTIKEAMACLCRKSVKKILPLAEQYDKNNWDEITLEQVINDVQSGKTKRTAN